MIGRLIGATFLLLLVAAATFAAGRPAAATEGIEVRSQAAQNRFPDGVQFTLFLASDSDITSVRLRFRVLPGGVSVSARPQCTSGRVVNCTVTVGITRSSYMVPGADIVYAWQIEDASGDQLETAEALFTYEDDRFDWESVSEGNLTAFFYFGNDETQRAVLRTARETIDQLSALLRTEIDFPVKIWVYTTARDMQSAVASRLGRGPNTSVQTLGEVGASDTALVSRDTDFLNIVRHELAHIVSGQATANHISDLPVWISEGISTYAQRVLLPSEAQALALAIRRDAVLPITSLSASARGTADVVSLFYAESGSIIAHLIASGGEEAFGEFISVLGGETVDDALMQVYGIDRLGLENDWRQRVGLPAVSSDGGGTAANERPLPTIVPFGAGGGAAPSDTPVAAPEPSGPETMTMDAEDGSSSGLALIVGGVVVVVLALGGGVYLLRRRSRPAA